MKRQAAAGSSRRNAKGVVVGGQIGAQRGCLRPRRAKRARAVAYAAKPEIPARGLDSHCGGKCAVDSGAMATRARTPLNLE